MRGRRGSSNPTELSHRVVVALLLASLLVVVDTSRPAVADITYLYDELGRLISVVDPASDTAVYSYDAVGNLLGINELLGDVVDFLNPLSDVQDLVDLLEYLAEAQDEDALLRMQWVMP